MITLTLMFGNLPKVYIIQDWRLMLDCLECVTAQPDHIHIQVSDVF